MENKLQELTSRIYEEGVVKANLEAEKIISDAKHEADSLLANAKKESEEIMERVKNESQELSRNLMSELKMSARQAVSSIKQEISELIITKLTESSVKDAFNDKDFIKRIIETTIKNWNPDKDAFNLQLLLPEGDEKSLGSYFEAKQNELLKATLTLKYDDRINAGFKIGPGDGRYLISFTDEDFENFFKSYLRPKTNQLLYGGE